MIGAQAGPTGFCRQTGDRGWVLHGFGVDNDALYAVRTIIQWNGSLGDGTINRSPLAVVAIAANSSSLANNSLTPTVFVGNHVEFV